MKLTPEQLADFEEQGYIFLPECFSPEEVEILRSEAENIYRSDRQEVWREKSGAPRTAFAAHTYNEAFRILEAAFNGSILTLCAVSNYIRKPTRPEWIAHQDFTPIETVADDALLDYARSHRMAAE